jgi:hypothetical protein
LGSWYVRVIGHAKTALPTWGILAEAAEKLASPGVFTYTSRSWPSGQVFYQFTVRWVPTLAPHVKGNIMTVENINKAAIIADNARGQNDTGSPEDRRKAQEAGFDAHLVKPAELEDLEKALQG